MELRDPVPLALYLGWTRLGSADHPASDPVKPINDGETEDEQERVVQTFWRYRLPVEEQCADDEQPPEADEAPRNRTDAVKKTGHLETFYCWRSIVLVYVAGGKRRPGTKGCTHGYMVATWADRHEQNKNGATELIAPSLYGSWLVGGRP